MKNAFYKTPFTKKSFWLSSVVILGVVVHGFAQPLPALPPLPNAKPASNYVNSALPPLPALPPIAADSQKMPLVENANRVLPVEAKKEPVKTAKTVPAVNEPKNPETATSLPVVEVNAPASNAVTSLAPLPDLAPVAQTSAEMPLDISKPSSSTDGMNTALSAPNNALPPLADLPSLDSLSAETQKAKRPKSSVTNDAVKAAADDKGKAPTENSAENKDTATLGIPPLPGMLPLPGAVGDEKDMPVLPAIPEASANSSAKKMKMLDEKAKRSWEVVLEGPAAPAEINFNYRRVLLPNTIYSPSYNDDNQHLPLAVTRQDYEGLLFASVVKNDVETTRALLNAGTDIRAVNNYGQTLLSAAQMAGAQATERLLLARGAR